MDQEHLPESFTDRYTIEAEIDTGGMARVYRARDLKHERTVAIKVLRPDLAEAIGADRFLREIRTTANLSHPHILPLFDSGEADGLLYYVMPFVKGASLADRLEREGQLPVEDAVQIAREVTEALAYAHRNGVIHRDVKPANIMLDEGHALLADFGIAQAKAGAGETRLTSSGMSLGTPSYMSPEQISGDRGVHGRADQYALACVLFEMLAGHAPFTGTDVQTVLRQHLAVDAPPVTEARSSVQKGIADALHRALAKAPADRFRSMEELEKALADATLPLLARTPMGRARSVIFGAAAVLALAAAAWVGRLVWPEADPGWQPDPNVVAIAPFENLTGDPAFDDYGELVAAHIIDRLGYAALATPTPLSSVRAVLDAASPDDLPVLALSENLGAGTVITGALYRVGDSLSVRAEGYDAVNHRA